MTSSVRNTSPPAEFLVDYATGTAPAPIAVLVASHIALNAASRTAVRQLETIGGTMLDSLAPAPVDDLSLDRVLAQLGDQETPRRAAAAPSGIDASLPAALHSYVPEGVDKLAWRWRAWGLREAVLPCAAGPYRLSLLRMRPGGSIARHTHRGPELTLVLEGGFTDGNGHYGRGDVCFADDTVEHHPIADPDRECLCLIVRSGPVRFKGLIGLLLAPFIP